jgi:drug/metabolite transporter (DMT)-like permease
MTRGILLVIGACVIWGLIYAVPLFMTGFNPLEVAFGRYVCFGSVSLAYMLLFRRSVLWQVPRSLWVTAFFLAFLANVGFYPAAVLCMRYSNPAIAALILGLSPISIALWGNWKERECSFKSLLFPCITISIGLILVNIPSLQNSSLEGSYAWYTLGLIGGFTALGLWSVYAVANGKCMKKHPEINASDWCSLIGIATFALTLALLPFYALIMGAEHMHKFFFITPELQNFWVGSAVLGMFCSWMGFFLWNKGSSVLPVSLAGQLTIFETLFGLLYVYFLEERWPLGMELIGVAVMLGAIYYSIRLFSKEPVPTVD